MQKESDNEILQTCMTNTWNVFIKKKKKIRTLATIPDLTDQRSYQKNKPCILSKGKDSLQIPYPNILNTRRAAKQHTLMGRKVSTNKNWNSPASAPKKMEM